MTQAATTKKDIRLIVIDLDGTLLNSKMELTERTEKAIKAAMAQGVQVALATGKSRNAAKHLLERLSLNAPGIFLQGLVLYDANGKVTSQTTLSPEIARRVITYAEDRGFSIMMYSGERILTRAPEPRVVEAMRKYHETVEVVGPLQNLLDSMPVHKLVAVGNDGRSVKALRWQLNAQFAGRARLVQAGIAEMLEILPPGASKGTALKTLTKDLRIPADHVMAIGDAENDMEMIQYVGLGVVMGQAEQAVKDVADYVAPTNDEDGVAEAIERFVLPPPPAPEAKPADAEKSAEAPKTDAPKATKTEKPTADKPADSSPASKEDKSS